MEQMCYEIQRAEAFFFLRCRCIIVTLSGVGLRASWYYSTAHEQRLLHAPTTRDDDWHRRAVGHVASPPASPHSENTSVAAPLATSLSHIKERSRPCAVGR